MGGEEGVACAPPTDLDDRREFGPDVRWHGVNERRKSLGDPHSLKQDDPGWGVGDMALGH